MGERYLSDGVPVKCFHRWRQETGIGVLLCCNDLEVGGMIDVMDAEYLRCLDEVQRTCCKEPKAISYKES